MPIETKDKSISWLLAKTNLGIFVLFVFPFTFYAIYIASFYKIRWAKLSLLFLEILAILLLVGVCISIIPSLIDVISKKKRAITGLIVQLLLGAIYLILAVRSRPN